ncbi:MAG: protein kinase [Acidobacteriota bacterium]
MSLAPGTLLGPYEILAPLGAGGMGEVYKARDTRLDRVVAVKVSAEQFSERFAREARSIASLNHPHICTVHDVGPNYLVMEYLEGDTLAQRIAKGPVPFAELMTLALQMADALAAAHQKGITHRDIKPANVMLVKTGPKLLDFGLARMERMVPVNDETVTLAAVTTPGTILGTFQYMAPEQLEGKEADARSDIFSFGALLHEMATGERAFKGKSQVGLIAAILEHTPAPVSSVQPMAPAEFDRFLAVCLSKNPEERFQTAREVIRELKWIAERPAALPATAIREQIPVRKGSPLPWAAAAVGLLAAAGLAALHFTERPVPVPHVRFNILPPEGVNFAGGTPRVAISPDGTQIAFNANSGGGVQTWVRRLDSLEARAIPGTEGSETPFWSSDSKTIGFFADRKLKRVDVAGGPVQILCDGPGNDGGGAWSPDGKTILFSGRNPDFTVHRVSASGGVATAVTKLAAREVYQRYPRFLPDGKHFIYFASGRTTEDEPGIFVASIEGGEPKRLLTTASQAEFAGGQLFYRLGDALMARPFDPGKLAFTGEPVPLSATVSSVAANGRAAFSVSQSGYLIFAEGVTGGAVRRLVWMDRNGKETGVIETGPFAAPALSPDGKFLAIARQQTGKLADVWVVDLARQVPSKITFDEATDTSPVWSPDSLRVAFQSLRNGQFQIYTKAASGLGDDQLLLKADVTLVPTDWSMDGKFLLFIWQRSISNRDFYAFPMTGPAGKPEPIPVQTSAFDELAPAFSPDGKWIAFSTNESGQYEVVVRSFPGNERKIQVSTGGGMQPQWRRDGKELYFRGLDGGVRAVPIKSLAPFEPGVPALLFSSRITDAAPAGKIYSPNADGSRFLVNQPVTAGQQIPLTVVQNWQDLLRK